ncbi:flagellar transcriptional regulator FlhC [Alcaligenaceae bacterium]|nr:flagellar transcriptional regulator FlhC [Alcaligenaceae bacterium]
MPTPLYNNNEISGLGARLQVLQAETGLSYDRLARLYREVKGCSPPKGMLPFSVDWFMTWLPNIHSSMFYSVYQYMDAHTPAKKSYALVEAYRLYLEQSSVGRINEPDAEPVLSFTRAWMLVRFFDSNMVQLSQCERCKGNFVAHAHDPEKGFVCAICRPPPRAGKTRAHAAAAKRAKAGGGLKVTVALKTAARPAAAKSSVKKISTIAGRAASARVPTPLPG